MKGDDTSEYKAKPRALQSARHEPVLLQEVLIYLDPQPGEFVIDGTVDGGGHSAEIFQKLLPHGKLLGIDLDGHFLEIAERNILAGANIPASVVGKNLFLAHGNYADLPRMLRERRLPKADGLLLDLGFSSEQLAHSGRGFSFLTDEPLLMTYDEARTPAREVLQKLNEHELTVLIARYGGERFAKRIARAIKVAGNKKKIETTRELAEVISRTVPRNYEMRRLNPATRTFQALRIYVNDELGNLEKLLQSLPEVLSSGGRAVVISFHSLEDALVKNYFKKFEQEGSMKILTKKPITSSAQEVQANPRSRSAKFRACVMQGTK